MWLRLGLCWAFVSTETNTRFACRLPHVAFVVAEELTKCLVDRVVQAELGGTYVEIKGQLDATDCFYCKTYCSLNMFRSPLCPSSGAQVLYRWLLPVVLGALVYRSLVWCGAVGYVSGLRDVAASRKPDT